MIVSDVTLRNWKPTSAKYPPGRYAVHCERARGLYVRMFESGAITWVFRYQHHGKQRHMGLGPYPAVGLEDARDKARAAYAHVKAGRDPVAVEQQAVAAAKADAERQRTFADAVDDYMKTGRVQSLSEKNRKLRRNTLDEYAIKHIGDMPVSAITTDDIKRVLAPIWNEKREMSRKLVQWMAQVFALAVDDGHRPAGLNPAGAEALKVWRGNQAKVKVTKSPAVRVRDMPAWFAALRTHRGSGARALEFLALTAVRSGEVREMVWSEVDFEDRIWSIPADRMKMERPHRVPLSDAAVALLQSIERREGVNWVFPNARDGALSANALLNLMNDMHAAEVKAGRKGWLDYDSGKPAVPHGLRSTFKDWAIDCTHYPNAMSEIALAHAVGDETENAYRRSDMMEKRRAMMNDWSNYITGAAVYSDNVIPIRASGA